ncbi:MAG: rod shape-determining protein MreC [Patescibacteria group bacterium]
MRRRSVRARFFALGTGVLLLVLAFAFKLMLPVERFLIDTTSRVLLGYDRLTLGAEISQLAPDSIFVVGRHAHEFSDIAFLNKSLPVSTVIVRDRILIGFVIESGNRSSKVEIITSPVSRVDGIFERSGISTVFQGFGAELLQAELPKGSDVQIGDTVYWAEDPSLVMGTVARIDDLNSEPFLRVLVKHAATVSTLLSVLTHDR